MKICCVVVLYNPTEENLSGIKSYSDMVDSLIIVDNSDGERKYETKFKEIKNSVYIPLNGNMGLGYALNVGCKEAIKAGFKYAITMDQDSVLSVQGFEQYKLSISDYKKAALISPQYIIDRKKDVVLQNKVTETVWTMQSACIFNLEILQTLGFFNEDLFIDTIDYEYCLRARKNGYKVLVNCNYAIKHSPAITKYTKLFKLGYGYCSPLRIYYQSRNLRYLRKNYGYWKITLIILIKYLKIIFLFDNKREFLKMWKQGKRDFKRNIAGKKN